jgi:hypothetical protein
VKSRIGRWNERFEKRVVSNLIGYVTYAKKIMLAFPGFVWCWGKTDVQESLFIETGALTILGVKSGKPTDTVL